MDRLLYLAVLSGVSSFLVLSVCFFQNVLCRFCELLLFDLLKLTFTRVNPTAFSKPQRSSLGIEESMGMAGRGLAASVPVPAQLTAG